MNLQKWPLEADERVAGIDMPFHIVICTARLTAGIVLRELGIYEASGD
jgi:hypothetical protein